MYHSDSTSILHLPKQVSLHPTEPHFWPHSPLLGASHFHVNMFHRSSSGYYESSSSGVLTSNNRHWSGDQEVQRDLPEVSGFSVAPRLEQKECPLHHSSTSAEEGENLREVGSSLLSAEWKKRHSFGEWALVQIPWLAQWLWPMTYAEAFGTAGW
jgi:hypothetical protein